MAATTGSAKRITPRMRAALLHNLEKAHAVPLSETGRERLRAACRRNRPWERSTGPRTAAGKRKSRLNATREGEWGAGEWSAESRALYMWIGAAGRLLHVPIVILDVILGKPGAVEELLDARQMAALKAQFNRQPDFANAEDPIAAAQAWLREQRRLQEIERGKARKRLPRLR